jgi:DNA-binding MarR family transcriptional regulator/GNAT superfamily N-acetyltransferase
MEGRWNMPHDPLQKAVETVRSFNRFYTKRMGLLNPRYLKTKFPLTQARILYELAHRKDPTASELIQELNIDPGYLSRILSVFAKNGLIGKSQSTSDSRFQHLKLTTKGRKTFSELNEKSNREMGTLLKGISRDNQSRLLQAMRAMQTTLNGESGASASPLIRTHRPGDAGWIIFRHGELYAEEYGYDETFEGLVADILAHFLEHHDPKRERLWIAERDGERVGSVMIVKADEDVAQLRIFLVEPKARGMGIGKRLIQECIDFSKRSGYNKIKLWTHSELDAARHLYVKAGFKIVEKKRHHSFGRTVVDEVWELAL